jgi:predicted acetyltransferase
VRLQLRALGPQDEETFLRAQQAMQPEGFLFGFDYDEGMPWASYLALLEAQAGGWNLAPNRVPATLLVGDVGGEVVGRISIRHDLNPRLAEVGGHIGYCVLPAHRRRGYATEMLRQALRVAHDIGIPNALVTCDEDNVASRKTIEACGGVFERHAVNPGEPLKRRYWVPTAG